METKAEKIVKLSGIIDNKAKRVKKLKVECGQKATKICILNLRIKELEEELEQHRWIPVNLGPPYNNRPKESGKILILTDQKKIFAVYITVGEDEFENKDGQPFMCPTHSCFLAGYGSVLLGEDSCITHWKPIVLPLKGE